METKVETTTSPKLEGTTPQEVEVVSVETAEGLVGQTAATGGTEQPRMENEGVEVRSVGDLPGYSLSDADRMLDKVFGDHVHQNDGKHLDGGILDDTQWQEWWSRLITLPPQRYAAPKGTVGKRFVEMLTKILEGVSDRKWNSEQFIVFQIVILQRTKGVSNLSDIRKRIVQRMDAWDNGQIKMLVETAERDMRGYLQTKRGGLSPEQRLKKFNQRVISGDLRGAIKFLSETEEGGVLMPDEIDSKSGDTVEEVLQSKHPEPRTMDASKLQQYTDCPDFVNLDVTSETVEKVSARLSGSAGLGGADAEAVSNWLLQFGDASRRLRNAVAKICRWMANDFPPWAAYRALMSGRLIGLDKMPGVRPVGIGETWRRLSAKCILSVAGEEAKESCGAIQLCARLKSGIDGAIHDWQHL